MADPVAVGIDVSTFLFLVLLGLGLVGVVAYMSFNKFATKEETKKELKSELLDKEQTKELMRINRELDKLERKIEPAK